MNYNALLLLDKHHKHKINFSLNASNINQLSFFNNKNNHNINVSSKDIQKYKKCYSVKPSMYMIPKDVIVKEIFENAIKSSNNYKKEYGINDKNINNDSNINRKYIFEKIKKFVLINHINYSAFVKTIFLYDLLYFQKEKVENSIKKFESFYDLDNLSIALISFIIILKFNSEENKMLSLKKFVKNFEEGKEKIIFENICEMEIIALQLINYNLTFQTPFSFLELFLINGIIFNEDCIHSDLSFDVYDLANETLEKIMKVSNEYFKYNYFYLSCSVIMFVRERFKINRWPKALEITFDVNYEEFYDIYNIFFTKNNKSKNINNINNKINIKSFYNADIINISNLKNMSNIISVLKIMKSADKYKKAKDQINKLDLFNKKEEKEENFSINNNNDSNININSINRIKVGLKKNWNTDYFKSPGKLILNKSSKSSILAKMNQENKNLIDTLYNKNIENNKKENMNEANNNIEKNEAKKNEEIQIKKNDSNTEEILKKDSFDVEKNKIYINKSTHKYRKNKSIVNKNYQENYRINDISKNSNKINDEINNNSKINIFENYTLNVNFYKKINYMNKRNNKILNNNQKEIIPNNLNYSNINSYNLSSKNSNLKNKISNRYYSKYTEKKRNFIINNNLIKKNNFNLNQTSFNDFLYSKNKKNKINENNNESNYNDNFISKNKEESSNAPTCESSNLKISLNDFSIRKSYRLKKNLTKNEEKHEEKLNISPKKEKNKKYEKEYRKILEKNKSYNKLLDPKKSFSESTYNRKTGVRKYYKQKNLLENQ